MIAYTTSDSISFITSSLLPETITDEKGEKIENPQISGLTPIEYPNDITLPTLVDGEIVQGRDIAQEEIEKRQRVTSLLISAPDYESVDTEGVTGFDIDSMIVARFFGGDRGREIGFTQRMIYLSFIANPTKEDLVEREKVLAGYDAKEKFKNYIKSL